MDIENIDVIWSCKWIMEYRTNKQRKCEP